MHYQARVVKRRWQPSPPDQVPQVGLHGRPYSFCDFRQGLAEQSRPPGRPSGEFFGQVRPAATMVVVAKLLNPAWRIEIEMDAVIPGSTPQTSS